MKKSEVKFIDVTKKFNETIAVDNVSCSFEPGTLTTILGPSGCGKTTSLRLIAGLERATQGSIFIDDEDVTLLPATDRDVSMVFQSYALFPHMSVVENVSYGLKMINAPKEEYIQKSFETLKLVGLEIMKIECHRNYQEANNNVLRWRGLLFWNRKFFYLTNRYQILMLNLGDKLEKI